MPPGNYKLRMCPRGCGNWYTPFGSKPTEEQVNEYPYPALDRDAEREICSACGTQQGIVAMQQAQLKRETA